MRLGIISDTNGHLHPKIFSIFTGVDKILHAGGIGSSEVLEKLSAIAPVVAVTGRNEKPELSGLYPEMQILDLAEKKLILLNGYKLFEPGRKIGKIYISLALYSPNIVVYGHTHKPRIIEYNKTLFVNPGSASRRLLKVDPSVALLTIENGSTKAHIIPLL